MTILLSLQYYGVKEHISSRNWASLFLGETPKIPKYHNLPIGNILLDTKMTGQLHDLMQIIIFVLLE